MVIRRGGATNLISLIERMVTRAVEDNFDTKEIVVQITWRIDNFDDRKKEDADHLQGAIRYIARELRRKVFIVQRIGPGLASASLTTQQMKDGKAGFWNSIADELYEEWSTQGLNRWDGGEMAEKLPHVAGNPRRKKGGPATRADHSGR